ncbi:FAS1 domain-containing protein [Aspergillus sergii]|uniref:FAS1 domain-containing protein n=1 Tax=Aspergillus sergii TaxID=1034303 RepID=A0A5N6X4C8_9EURO|nr:FAS1 domain-containing protein [Aspergillus sergii]
MPRFKRIVVRIAFAATAVGLLALMIQMYLKFLLKDLQQELLQTMGKIPTTSPAAFRTAADEAQVAPTLWDHLCNDSHVSKFSGLLMMLDEEREMLSSPDGEYTLFAPIDDAFPLESFDWDLPEFYWLFLVQYHLVKGTFSMKDLEMRETLPTHIWADIYESYSQRMSSQFTPEGSVRLNHRSTVIQPDVKASNGYLHYVDRVIMLPGSTADVLRYMPEFSTLREGLIHTELATIVNDTSLHNGHTFFAPSNTAFQKLGPAVNHFLFSPWGKECLRALLEYHILGNQTLFTNSYFRANGRGPGQFHPISPGFEAALPTMIAPLHVNAAILEHESRGKITINHAVDVVMPDIVVQDGVIHCIDDILLPPKTFSRPQQNDHRPPVWEMIRTGLFGPRKLTVEELLERFEPYLTQGAEKT